MEEYDAFVAMVVALTKLVILSIIIERGFAFIFEHDWFVRLYYKKVPDPKNSGKKIYAKVPDPMDPEKKILLSRAPGLKGVIVLVTSWGICQSFCFDILQILFKAGTPSFPGILVTSFVVAGGSAGAIAVFQGFLNISKDSRDALVATKKAEAESAKQIAELAALEAKAKKEKAEAEAAEAKAKKEKAEAEATEAKAKKEKAEAEA